MTEAEKWIREARSLEEQGDLAGAALRYRRALQLSEGREARDLCLTLADLDMQQGNLHGADVWYVLATEYPEK